MKFDISIDHYKQQCTSNRNLELLKKAVKKNPNNSRNLFYLAKELNDNANFAEAEPYFLKFIECQDAFYEDKITALELLAQHARNEYSFKSFIFKSLRLEDCRKEPYYLLGMYYFDNKNFLAAIHYYKICIATERNPDLLGSSLTFYTSNSWLQLCLCYNSLGRMKEAYEANEKYLELTGKNEIGLNNRKLLSKYINTKKDGLGKKLNIGCGAKKIEGYVSCDVFKTPIVDEIFSMDDVPYLDNTISAIYSEHSLEHLCFADATKALKEWFRCLQYGGELNLLIPDLELCCKGYLESTNEAQINYIPAKTWYTMCIFGAQTDQNGSIAKHQFHLSGWSKQEIKCLLEAVGFVVNSIENYNGWGTLSINIHALKPRQVEKTLEIKTCWVCANNEEGAQARIRVLNVSKELQKQGFVSDVIQDYNKALEYDIIIIGKSFSEYDYNSVKILKDKGKTVYCDLCEDILEFPFVADIIKVCDKIICCSQKLAEKVSIINKNTIIIEEAYEA
jgi:tetratricopeptide (TPR) repeat protein